MSRSERITQEIKDTAWTLAEAQGWKCASCGKSIIANAQIAHRIPQNTANMRKYGAEIIHHRLNLGLVCGLACNARLSITKRTAREFALVEKIRQAIKNTCKHSESMLDLSPGGDE